MNTVIDRPSIVDEVLLEFKRVSEAPSRVEDLPGYSPEFTPEELDSFRLVALALERKKRYKTVDLQGNIFLVGNPWARVIETRKDGTCWVVYPKPFQVFTYAEAKQEAKRLKSAGVLNKPEDEFEH